jgi:hypothetical protein
MDGSTSLGSVPVNQQLSPDDFSPANETPGVFWENLGPLRNISGTTVIVRLSDLANGYAIADAIRLERIGDLPPERPDVRSNVDSAENPAPSERGSITRQQPLTLRDVALIEEARAIREPALPVAAALQGVERRPSHSDPARLLAMGSIEKDLVFPAGEPRAPSRQLARFLDSHVEILSTDVWHSSLGADLVLAMSDALRAQAKRPASPGADR